MNTTCVQVDPFSRNLSESNWDIFVIIHRRHMIPLVARAPQSGSRFHWTGGETDYSCSATCVHGARAWAWVQKFMVIYADKRMAT